MPRNNDLEKTWLPGPSRGTQTFNAPSNITIPYGRHKATVSGTGGPGNAPIPVYSISYTTNYNIAHPIDTQPATAWATNYITNYNTVYPIDTQPIANQPATAYATNYNTVYPIANQPEASRPINTYIPGNAGGSTTVLGVYFPGGAVGTPAPYVSDKIGRAHV